MCGRKESDNIDAVMQIEAFVLGINEGSDEDGRNLFVGDGCSVLVEVTSHQHVVAGIDFGGFVYLGVFNIVETWRTAEEVTEVAINGNEEQNDEEQEGSKPSGSFPVPRPREEEVL